MRQLRRTPGFSLLAVLTLAVGIGAACAVFSVVDAVLLRALPYPDAGRLVAVQTRVPALGITHGQLSLAEAADVATLPAFNGVVVSSTGDATVALASAEGARPDPVRVTRASATLFNVLGVTPRLGRGFGAEENVPGAARSAVLTDALWRARFGGDPAVVGRTIRVDGVPLTVSGVMPAGFRYDAAGLYVPLPMPPASAAPRGAHDVEVVARLAPGADVRAGEQQLAALVTRLRRLYPYGEFSWAAVPLQQAVAGDTRPVLFLLGGAVLLVLAVACVNTANLFLLRAERRRSELALRSALGAGRLRLVGQLATEAVVLTGGAATLGLLGARLAVPALLAAHTGALPPGVAVTLDTRVALLAAGLAGATGVIFGVLPLFLVAVSPLQSVLRQGGRGGIGGRSRLQQGLVAGELAVTLVLVMTAMLLVRSLQRLRAVDPGVATTGVLTGALALPAEGLPAARIAPTAERIAERLQSLAGVRAAGVVWLLPLTGQRSNWDLEIEGRPTRPGEPPPSPRPQAVTPGALDALGLTPLRGRPLASTDAAYAPLVSLVSETMARALWGTGDPLGRRFRQAGTDREWITVVGVVRDVRSEALAVAPAPEFWLPLAQMPRVAGGFMPRTLAAVVRTTGVAPATLVAPMRAAVAEVAADVAVAEVRTMGEVLDTSLARQRFAMLLLGGFGAVTIVLAVIGLYGVLSYVVAQRRRELGVRLALGATPRAMAMLVLRQAGLTTLCGLTGGLAVVTAGGRLLGSLLYGVSARDPVALVFSPVLLAALALSASLLPTRRAMRTAPGVTLRAD